MNKAWLRVAQPWQRLALSAGAVLALLMPTAALGAVQGIGISPTSLPLELEPGSASTGQITVINDGDRDVKYHIYATDYKVDDESYVGDFTSSASQANASPVSWFTLPKGEFTAKSRQESQFSYTLTVPKTATVGGHYGAVFVETIPPNAQAGALISRIERIGTLFYVTVKGNTHESGRIEGLTVAPLQSTAPVKARLRLRNDGNVHFLAEGSVQLSNPFGLVGKALPFKGEVLPGTTRRFDLQLPATSPIGLFKVTTTTKYLGQTEETSAWMVLMPRITFLILSGTLMLLLGIGVATLIRRSRKKRQQ